MTPASRPARRLALAAGLLTAVLISCGREITGPVSAPVNAFKRIASLAFDPQYTTALSRSALHAALTQVAFERVHITLRREDGSIALDTVVDFPAGADSLTLSLIIPLPANTPSTGLPFSLNLGYVNAAGDTVFKGGPFPVTVTPSTAGGSAPPPVQVPVHYTGTGASATSVIISPKLVNGTAGLAANFSATARGSDGSTIAGTPIVFTSSDNGVVTVNSTSGAATLVGRGSAKVYAQLLTGPSDSATVNVVLPASTLEVSSGSGQTAPAGTTLPQPVVARVLATDGIGVGGVTVNFAVTSGGGSVTPASAVSAADGSVSTAWKLGGTAGTQAMTVTSAGLAGSPVSVTATALPVVASRLSITTGPVGGKAGAPIGAVVAAQDALGNTVTSFTGDVTVAIGTNPGGATLGGTATVKAVNGVATFSALTLNKPGTGYTLTFSSATLSSVTSAAFNILAGDAAKLVFGAMPAAADVGTAIAPPIQVFAQDSTGNTVTSFTGAVTVAIGTNAGGGTLTGTLTRNAVAGVATFNDLSINKKGSSYTLVASATGLVSGASAAFNMAPGAPTGISVVSGGGQTALAGSALAPMVLQLHDALGNGIAGVTITLAVATGGGSLAATSLLTDADGTVTANWTLGNTGGLQTITATSTGVPVATFAATATVPPTSAKTLLIATQPQASQVAGTSGTSIVVQAKDSLGALVPTFISNVSMTIASGPPGATVIGPVSVAAVAGVATFSGVSFDKAGAYTVTFASAGLTSATSTSFTVAAGAAKNIVADSGQAQSGLAGQALGASLVAKVTDQYGNPVGAGTSLTWAVATGGGSIDSTTTLTNSAGRTRVKWTLGGTIGAQSVNVTGAGLLPNPLTFTATGNGVAYSKLWTGAVDTLSSTAGNWSPSGAPSATDSVRVDSVANMMTLIGSQTIAKLIVSPGARVNLNGNYLTVSGSVNVGGGASFTGGGVMELTGTTGTIVGPALPYTNFYGAYTLTGSTNFTGSVEVKTGGILNTNGFNASVAGIFSTSTSGVLQMASGTVTVGGNAFFAGGSENGLLTGGTLRIRGNFTQSSSGTGAGESFRSSGTHQVVFDSISASGLVHTVAFAAPDTALTATCTAGRSCFNVVNFTHVAGPSAGVKFTSSAKALGAVDLTGMGLDSLVMPAASLLTVAGNFSTGCCNPRRFNRVALGGATNNGGVSGVTVDTMIFFGAGQTAAANGILIGTTSVRISGTASMAQGSIPGDVTVDGATAVLDIATTAGYVQVLGNFATKNGGKLKMTDAPDSLYVGGNMSFAGGSTAGLLTAGFVHAGGSFESGGAGADPQSFSATSGHEVSFQGSGSRRLRMLNGGFGASHFAELYHGFSDTLYLKTDVYAESFETGIVSMHPLRADTSFAPLLVAKGADLRNVLFDGTRFELDNGQAVTDLDNVAFINQDPATTQFTIKRTGTGTAGAITALSGSWTFATTPTTGRYLDAQDTDGYPTDSLFVDFDGSVSPASNGGKATFSGGAHSNWPAGGTYAAANSGDWNNPATWSPSGVPGASDDVTVSGEHTVTLSGNAAAHHLTLNVGAVALGGFNLKVTGDVAVSSGGISGSGTLVISGAGAHTLPTFNAPTLFIDTGAVVTMSGNIDASGDVAVAGKLVLNGHWLDIMNGLYVTGTGGVKMTNPADTIWTYDAEFGGVASDTLLTAGYLGVTSNFSQVGGAKSFAPTGTFVTALFGGASGLGLRASRAARPGSRLRSRSAVETTAASTSRRRRISDNTVTFSAPGYASSHFNTLLFDHTNDSDVQFGTDVYALAAQTVGMTSFRTVSAASPHKLFVKSVDLMKLAFSRIAVQIDAGGTITTFDTLSFTNQDPTGDQLTVALASGTTPTFQSLLWNTPPTSGRYLVASTPGSATLTLQSPNPGSHGGKIGIGAGVTLLGWTPFTSYVNTGDGDWSNPSTWSPLGVPGAFDSVTVTGDATVYLTGNTTVHHLTLTDYGAVSLGYNNLTVTGNVYGSQGNVNGSGTLVISGAGAHALAPLDAENLFVDTNAVVTMTGNVSVSGNVDLAGILAPNGHWLDIYNNGLYVSATGGLKMTNPADTVWAYDAEFGGVASDTLLTAGYLGVTSNFSQVGTAKSFAPTGTFVTALFAGGYGGGYLRSSRAAPAAVARERAPKRVRSRSTTEVATAGASRTRRNYGTNTVSFANPGYASSHFNALLFDHTNDSNLEFGSDVYAVGAQTVGLTSFRTVSSSSPQKFFVKSVDLFNLDFYHVAVQVDAGGTIAQFDSLHFSYQDPTVDQLTLNLGGSRSFTNLYWDTRPTTGRFLKVNGAATATLVNPTPGSHGGYVATSGGAVISGWPSSLSYQTTGSGGWGDLATWSPAGVPGAFDDVTINAGHSVTIDGTYSVRNVTVQGSGGFSNPGWSTTLAVYGNWTADTLSTFTTTYSNSVVNFKNPATISGTLFNAQFDKSVTLGGPTVFKGDVNVGLSSDYTPVVFDVNGQYARVRGGFYVYYGGQLKMTNPADNLTLIGSNWDGFSPRKASFTGLSTDGMLTAGTLRIDGAFEVGTGASFSATGTHTTIISDFLQGGHSLKFGTPGTSNLTSHFGVLQFSDQTHSTILRSDAYAVTSITTVGHTGPVLVNRDGSLPIGTAPRLHTANINTTVPFTFDRVGFRIYNADATTTFQGSTFLNFQLNAGEDQFTVENNSASPVTINGISGLTFSTLFANTQNYAVANQLGAGLLTVNLSGMSPNAAGSAGKRAVTGGAVLNWTP